MKKNILRLLLLFTIVSVSLVSCQKPDVATFQYGATPIVSGGGTYDLQDPGRSSATITIEGVAEAATVSSIVVLKSFNGGEAVEHATINKSDLPAELNIPATAAAEGTGADFSQAVLGDYFDFSFLVNTEDGRTLKAGPVITVPLSCPSSLSGTYTVTTTYSQHDFLPDYDTNTFTAEIVDEGDGFYSVTDFSGGLYSEGPYVAAYGTADFPVVFREICSEISWTEQEDTWGAVVAAPGGQNSVSADGVITISWLCEAYGESGVSVYTPQ